MSNLCAVMTMVTLGSLALLSVKAAQTVQITTLAAENIQVMLERDEVRENR